MAIERVREYVNPCPKSACDCGGQVDPHCGLHSKGCAWLRSMINVTWLPTKTIEALAQEGVELWRVWERGLTTPQWYARPALETVLRASGVWYLPGKVDPPLKGFNTFVGTLISDKREDGLPEALDLICYTAGRKGNKTKVEAMEVWQNALTTALAGFDVSGELRTTLDMACTVSRKALRSYALEKTLVGD